MCLSGRVCDVCPCQSRWLLAQVRYLAFSAHTDAAGILKRVTTAAPRAVMLVHGDRDGMQFMAEKVTRYVSSPCCVRRRGKARSSQV
jgi:integrator complex subunit 11